MRVRHFRRFALAIATPLAAALLLAPATYATKTHLFLEYFGSAAQPSFRALSLAIQPETGDLLVLDAASDSVLRFKLNGEPDPFPALGTNVIDAAPGPGAKPCAEEPASCDLTPQGRFSYEPSYRLGAGQIAVDDSAAATHGNIYVTDRDAHVVDVFAPSGEYLGQLTAAGTTPFGANSSHVGPTGVAVDPTGHLFVADAESDRVYKFSPGAKLPLNSDLTASFVAPGRAHTLAAGAGPSAGLLFAGFEENNQGVLKLSTGSLASLGTLGPPGFSDLALAVDSASGDLYAGELLGSGFSTVREYDSGGGLVSSFRGPGGALAVDGSSGLIYGGLSDVGRIQVFGPLVTLPEPTTGTYSALSNTSLRLQGTIDPDGEEIEECNFEYLTDAEYEANEEARDAEREANEEVRTELYSGAASQRCAESPASIGAGTEPVAVHADISGLASEATYHYRLSTKNPNGTVNGKDRIAQTPTKPTIEAEWALDVSTDSATIAASVNPGNSPTRYRFEWGTDTGYGSTTGEIEAGSDAGFHTVRLSLPGLSPGTDYHYRITAINGLGTTAGPDRRLHTYNAPTPAAGCPNEAFRAGGAAALLPDCRAYELVSPLDKEGGDIYVLGEFTTGLPAVLAQASASGDRLAYGSYRAFGDAASAPYTSQYIAGREAGGWASHSIDTPEEQQLVPNNNGASLENEYYYFSEDLCQSWLIPLAEPTLAKAALPGYHNLYRRTDQLCGGVPDYLTLSTARSAHIDPFATPPLAIEVQGVSSNGELTAFLTNDNLEGTGAPSVPQPVLSDQLYVKGAAGAPKFACILPGGAKAEVCAAGTGEQQLFPKMRTASETGALSADGRRLFWSAASGGEAKIYLRENPLKGGSECAGPEAPCTVAVSEAGEALSGMSKSFFWAGAKDGSGAIYSAGDLPAGSADLYEYTVAGAGTQKIAGKLYGVLGQSDDLSRVYFASGEAIEPSGHQLENQRGEAPQAGRPNLYLYESNGAYRFIATLAARDATANNIAYGSSSATSPVPATHNGQVSPDGLVAAFMSEAPLTGSDNTDARSTETCGEGHPNGICDNEAFLYDATARGGEGELVCASCNPGGARPAGRDTLSGNNVFNVAARLPAFETTLHQPRALAADGKRLLFESVDPLAPRDTNGKIDVYQWEAPGEGGCTEESPGFSAQDGGCVDLLSSGHGPLDSGLVDASVSGNDAFFTTPSSLLPKDVGLIDIYDARVQGGQPEPSGPAASCEGEACQGAYEAPNDPTPASASFEGAGNVSEAPLARCAKPKVRRKGRCVAKQHRKRAKRVHHRAANPHRRAAR